jgi:hypothetical protein
VFTVVNEGAHRLSIHRIKLHWFFLPFLQLF